MSTWMPYWSNLTSPFVAQSSPSHVPFYPSRAALNDNLPIWNRLTSAPPTTCIHCPSTEEQETKDKLVIHLDVSQFDPRELKVRTDEHFIYVEGAHDERPDVHGLVERKFVRKYIIPKDVDPSTVTATIVRGGILVLEAPRIKKPVNKMEKETQVKHESPAQIKERQHSPEKAWHH